MSSSAPAAPLTSTLRDRLLLAFANLSSYGIAARPAYEATGFELAFELAVRHPQGRGAFVYWSATDDAAFSVAAGRVTLICSDEATLGAVLAACDLAGAFVPSPDEPTLAIEVLG